MKNKQDKGGFFEWVVSLFKRKEKPLPKEKTYEELAAEAKWLNIKARYALEYMKEHDCYFVKYRHERSGEYWYLRRWTEDYTLERARGNAIRLSNPDQLDQVIRLHQEWIAGGHISVSFD